MDDKKNKLTKEQYEKLTPYADKLKSAYKNSFARMSTKEFQSVADIYAEIAGKPLRNSQMNCNTCRLNTLRFLGELYLNYTEEEQAKKAKKPGRPRKLDNNTEEQA